MCIYFAEEEGVEPPIPFGMPDFKSGAIDHSATPLRVEISGIEPEPYECKSYVPPITPYPLRPY
jgi:hypothetical protein